MNTLTSSVGNTAAADLPHDIAYTIDADDRIVSVSGAWNEFALANDAPQLASPGVVGTSLWQWISDATTTQLYRSILDRVRQDHVVLFTFRCDSPLERRELLMRIAPSPNGATFQTSTIAVEPRSPATGSTAQSSAQALDNAARRPTSVRCCSWCKRIAVSDDHWEEPDVAVRTLGLFHDATPELMTHGICPSCSERVLAAIS